MSAFSRLIPGLGIVTAGALLASATATAASTHFLLGVPPAEMPEYDDADTDDSIADTDDSVATGGSTRRTHARQTALNTIGGRNPFCPSCKPPSADSPADGPVLPVSEVAGPIAARLLATMESAEASTSLATVYDPARGTRVLRVGDPLVEGAVVTEIGSGRLRYARGGAIGLLDVDTSAAPVTPGRSPAESRPPSPEPQLSDQVQCKAKGDCTVRRELVDELFANPQSLASLRAFPSGDGFKISGIRRGSLPHQLGLRNGDVLTEVNGRAMDSVDAALSLLPRLRTASNLSVSLQRRGKPVTHNVRIQ